MLDRIQTTLHRRESRPDLEPSRPRQAGERPRPSAEGRDPNRRLLWAAAIVAVLLLVAIFVSEHFDEWLRRTLEARANRHLQGYTVTLGAADLHFLALELQQIAIRQQAHPDPPVALIPRLTASVQWRELLRLHLVADAQFDQPRIHLNLPQLRAEDRDEVEVQDRGWQDALQSIYPLKFNRIAIADGDLVYVDQDPDKPLHVGHWNFVAENVRNVRATKEVYPSPVHTDGMIFGEGKAVVDGHADFLAEPYPGFHCVYRVENVPLRRLDPLTSRRNLIVKGGHLDSRGELELGPRHQEVRIDDVTLRSLNLDYVHTARTAAAEKERASEVVEAAKDQQPEVPVRIVALRVQGGEVGLVDRSKDPSYRVFLDRTDFEMTNFSSGFRNGPAKAKLAGRFMGSGAAAGNATFRPEKDGPDFDLAVAVENASLPKMNDLLRAYGKLDVVEGTFSVYSEMKIGDGRIEGYVKPLFSDVDVYDSEQDKDEGLLHKLYEKIVGGLSHLLDNEARDEVATVVDISGPIEDPDTSTWKTIVRLLRNAFVDAILPGFDREFEKAREED